MAVPDEPVTGAARYRLLPPDRPADDLEREVLAAWEAERLFARVQEARADGPPFVFFEGPPTANGRPGIHHVFARTIKDIVCRHRAMRGHFVARKAGWDTHGLPVEIEVEKQLGISGKADIERIGVEEFNRLCRESVWKYRGDWERLSARMGYWLDYDDPYITYSNDYIESVWWALKTLHGRGLLYRGHKILPYCARCGTTLSSHEVAQGYEDVDGPSLYVALDVDESGEQGAGSREQGAGSRERGAGSREQGAVHSTIRTPHSALRRRILVWTTTPWTLVSNVALAVHPELAYVELRRQTGAEFTLILAEARVPAVLGGDWDDRWEVVARRVGADMAGWRYRRPIDWVPYGPGEHQLIVAEPFVSADDGTGVVHMAPAFGADDYAAGQRHGLAFLQPVDPRGRFAAELPLVGDLFVKDADPLIIDHLREQGVLWKYGTVLHSYPHCWRCRTPLLYYARTSWFVRTTAFRDEMLARNARVDWHPESVGHGRFGEWLTNNIDWAVSRERYWGTPLPVWVNDEDPDEIEVIGSYAELAARDARPLPDGFDPHRPFVDAYSWPAPSGRGTMRRVPEVIDAWFDSGSMPFAQWHYPFEQQEQVARNYPADFIAEGLDQTRGWFYSLLAIATGLGDALPNNERGAWSGERGGDRGAANPGSTAPYRTVVVNDMVLDAQGQKMSKSRGNIVDPLAVIERHGVDAVRLFFVASSQLSVPRRFDEDAIRETAGRFLITLKNVYSGIFAPYASFGWAPSPADPAPGERPSIDRWILSRLATVEQKVDQLLGAYDVTEAARLVMAFVTEDVSNWYVRQTRPRYYDVTTVDNRAAFATLHEVLVVTTRLLAPFTPFVSDWLHRELTGASVHVAAYVRVGAAAPEPALEAAMAEIRELARLGRAAREEAGIKVRQPLAQLVCVVPAATPREIDQLLPLLAAELNVKHVEMASSADALVTLEARPNFRALGKTFGKRTPQAAQAVAALDASTLRAMECGDAVTIVVQGERFPLAAEDLTIVRRATGALVVQEAGGRFAAIDPVISPALRREGIAREFVSRVQRTRKESALLVSDRIRLWVDGDADVLDALREHEAWIASEVLARELVVGGEMPDVHHATRPVELDGLAVHVALTRDR